MKEITVIAAYDRLLESIGERASRIGARPVVSHWPHRGSDGARLLVVGQAVYGWPDDWRAVDAASSDGRQRILDVTRARNAGAGEPIGWIENSDRVNNVFWTSCRRLAEAIEPESRAPWWGRFTWANLFPVAWEADPDVPPGHPAAHPDNPGGELKKAQDPYVADLLRETVAWLDPEIVVVFGGTYWWPAAAAAPELISCPRPLIGAGVVDGRRWVVGWHPNGANRRGWNPERYIALILSTLP